GPDGWATAARLFPQHDGVGAEPGFEGGDDFCGLVEVVGRVGQHRVEEVAGGACEVASYGLVDDVCPALVAESGDVAPDRRGGTLVCFHENGDGRTAGEGLEPERTGAGVQVEYAGAHDRVLMFESGEDPL